MAARAIPENAAGAHSWRRAREFFASAGRTWQRAYIEWVTYFSPAMRQELYSEELARAVGGYRAEGFLKGWFARVRGAHPLDQASYVDLHSFLPHNLLEYGDRMSMAHALELRLPFTDHRLVELAMRTPAALKLEGGPSKLVLRRAMRDVLPREVLARPKLGLNPPLGIWLRGELAPLLERYLSPEAVRRAGWFQPQAVARLVNDFRAGRRDFSLHLWALLVLEQWRVQVLEADTAAQHRPAEVLEAAA
jgi:asparagine synthase (glutamine-hydrolysing)